MENNIPVDKDTFEQQQKLAITRHISMKKWQNFYCSRVIYAPAYCLTMTPQ